MSQEKDSQLLYWETQRNIERDSYGHVFNSSQNANKALLAFSGGGATATLTFIAALDPTKYPFNLNIIQKSLFFFIVSVFISIILSGMSFLFWSKQHNVIIESNRLQNKSLQSYNLKTSEQRAQVLGLNCSRLWILSFIMFSHGIYFGCKSFFV